MIILTDEHRARRIKRQRAINVLVTTTLFLTLAFAALLMIVARYFPQYANSPVLLIAMGIVSSIIGLRSGRILSASTPISDEIQQALKGFSDDTLLLNFYSPSQHLLLSPNGIFSLTALTQSADILADGSSLRAQNRFLTRFAWFLMGSNLGRPYDLAQDSARRAKEWLQLNTQTSDELTVQPLIILTHPNAHIESNQALVPILYADKRTPSLKQFIRRHEATSLSSNSIHHLIESLTSSTQPND